MTVKEGDLLLQEVVSFGPVRFTKESSDWQYLSNIKGLVNPLTTEKLSSQRDFRSKRPLWKIYTHIEPSWITQYVLSIMYYYIHGD